MFRKKPQNTSELAAKQNITGVTEAARNTDSMSDQVREASESMSEETTQCGGQTDSFLETVRAM